LAFPTTWKSRAASKLFRPLRLRPLAAPLAACSLALLVSCGRPGADIGAVEDQVGHRVAAGSSSRVVALAPDVAEMLSAIGVVGQLVAVSPATDFPDALRRLPIVSPHDVEAILAHHPDLVVASTAGNDPHVARRLAALGVRVCTVDATSCERLAAACELLGRVCGRSDAASGLAATLRHRYASATSRASRLPRRGALAVVWWRPLIVAAPGTFHDDLLRRAGLDNLATAGAGRYPQVEEESLLDPRLAVVVSADEPDVRAGFATVLGRPVGHRLAAGEVRALWLPADPFSRPGPRLVDALDALVAAREEKP